MLFFFSRGVLDEILNLIESVSEVFLSYFLSFVKAAEACAVLEGISCLEPSSETTAPKYLKLIPGPSFCSFTLISISLSLSLSLWMRLALFVSFFTQLEPFLGSAITSD